MYVLIVDDDPEDTELFCDAIGVVDPAIECEVCLSVETFEKSISDRKPDYIFVDSYLGAYNGEDVLRHIKAIAPDIAVVMYSTVFSPEQERVYRSLGCHKLIRKTNSFQELVHELRAVLT